ncbi:MAG TPA: hypothetical protein VL181_02885 [Holophagaceae bacterium]|nr:hypothetical protein [Holophagaceae bacterium]
MRSKAVLLALPILLLAASCKPKGSPDEVIRDTLSKAAVALEAGDAAAATAILDDRYQGPEGLNKVATRFYLVQLLKRGKVGVRILDQDVGVNGGDAFEKVHVICTQQGAGLLPDTSSKTYMLHWALRGSDWRVVDIQDFSQTPN